jgi:hypothetical protein
MLPDSLHAAEQWARIIGSLALVSPFLLNRIPALRPYAGIVAKAAAALYLLFGLAFVLWWLLIRQPAAG